VHTSGSVDLKEALVELKHNRYVTALVCGNLRTREMAKLPSKGRWCWKVGETLPGLGGGKGLHSFTYQLNIIAFGGTRVVGYLGGV
jgi:hypothetical protein